MAEVMFVQKIVLSWNNEITLLGLTLLFFFSVYERWKDTDYDEIKSNQKKINYCLTISGKSWTKFSDNIRRITTLHDLSNIRIITLKE